MKSFPPAPALFAAAVLAVAFSLHRDDAAPGVVGTAQAAQAATATPIPPPTDEPSTPTSAPARPPTSAPTAVPTPKPKPRVPTHVATPTPAPAVPTAPIQTPSPVPSEPSGTPIPLPTYATAKPHVAPSAPAGAAAPAAPSSAGGYTIVPRFERDPSVAKALRDPISELAQIAWMSGTWACTISVHDSPSAPLKGNIATTFVYDLTMNKRWLFGADGKGIEQHELTYDPLAKKWIFVRLGSNPAYGIATSQNGWTGNKITFEDEVEFIDGRDTHRRWTIVKRSPTHFTLTDEEQSLTGAWLLDDEYDFTKS